MRLWNLRRSIYAMFLGLSLLMGASGCMATRGWVQEQITPLSNQVTEVETRLGQTEAKAEGMTGRMAGVEAQLGETDTKAQLALKNLENLRLEQQFVLGVQEGATFDFNSVSLSAEAQQAIDAFLHSLQGTNDVIFLVTGHTDNIGPEAYNDALGEKRADNVAHYLITQKGINPLQVTVASYGERRPLVDNATRQGRRKNRRVEIQVYKQIIASAPGSQRLELERVSGR
jgi:outer membrane protein OmpA-like peptidoglycan-associated protein